MNTILFLPPSYDDHGDMIVIARGSILPCWITRIGMAPASVLCAVLGVAFFSDCGLRPTQGILPSPPSSHIPLYGRVLHSYTCLSRD